MVLRIMVPHYPAIGSGGVPPMPPTILMSDTGVGGSGLGSEPTVSDFLNQMNSEEPKRK
jgi:hypothetical protein